MSANVSNRQSYKPVEQPHAHVVDARLHGTVRMTMPASQGPSWARQGEPCRRSADGRFPEKAGTYRSSVPSGVGNPLRTGGRGSRSPGECGCHSLPHRKSRQWIPSVINAASGIRLASHHEYALMPLPQQDLCFLPDLVRIQCPADRLFIGSSECAVGALIGTEVGDVQRSKKDNPVSGLEDLFLHGFGRMKQFVQ